MDNEYIKIYRNITDSPDYFSERFDSTHALIDMMILSKQKEYNTGKDGEFSLSLSFLADRWKWERYQVQRFLARLEADGTIVRVGVRQKNCITTYLIIEFYSFEAQEKDGQ